MGNIVDVKPIYDNNAELIVEQNRDMYNSNNLSDVSSLDSRYIITIIGDGKIKSICINEFEKSIISFGRGLDNDIVLSSILISEHHGYFKIDNGLVKVVDKQSKNGIFVNNIKSDNVVLKDGDLIKVDNPNVPLKNGVLMIITVGDNENKWVELNLTEKSVVTIGRSNDCDIVLNRVSVLLKHAKITKGKDGYYIDRFDGKCNVMLNNSILNGQELLKDKDVILIDSVKIIYNNECVLYQSYDYGVRLDAIDIVKTVKLKGKNKDISQHVDFTATPGEFIAFVGGSGAGKSTFLKCISGVSKPTSGQVLINGNDLFNNYEVLKNLIGYVPQENIIFDDLSLFDTLKYATNLRMTDDATNDEKIKRINDVLEIVELLDKKDVMIRNLSGGQKKRACIAVELIADPKLFFLDEPTSGLDPGTERNVMKTLRKMADSGKTIILVTHNTLNLHLCDKVVFFGYGGKLCFDGKPSEALEFFKVDDFVDIYNMLNADTDGWRDEFNKSSLKTNPNDVVSEEVSSVGKKSKSFINQFLTLLVRKIKTLFNNKQQLLLIFGQAPLIAMLLPIVITDNLFYSYEETKAVLFSMSLACAWLGLLNSIQEICRERVVLEKEFMADLRVSAYIFSKVVYLFFLSLIQALLFVSTFMLIVDVPQNGVVFSWYFETVLTLFLTIYSFSSMGLLVSSIVKDLAVALILPALLLIPQLLFSGILFSLEGFSKVISNLILSKWSIEALGTSNDLNSLVSMVQEALPGYIREAESCFSFTVNSFYYDLLVIILMTVIMVVVSYFILKRQLESGR